MNGYHRLANLIASHDDLAIFRSFKSAYACDVLYLQAELHHLLRDWAVEVRLDQTSADADRRAYDKYFKEMRWPRDGCKEAGQWRKWMEIRGKLQEYRTAKETLKSIYEMPRPKSIDIQTLREWLRTPGGGHEFLRGSESDLWQECTETDLVSLAGDSKGDALTGKCLSFIHNSVTGRMRRHVELFDPYLAKEPLPTPLVHYSDSAIATGVGAVSTILSSLFPTMAIFALYFVQNPLTQLGLIVIFCTMFSAALVAVARARRVDCFAATAAFAAVQVVFIQGAGAGNCKCIATS